MLHKQTIDLVKSTAPILKERGEALTRHFYKRMFLHNPEVIPLFNSAHQRSGTQQKALADAICAYAANIDNLEVLGGAVELIAQKHSSLQIKPEHYPIVGENLLSSIREVLGEMASDEVIRAWSEAYGFLAKILIEREGQIYKEHVAQDGGWSGFKTFYVTKKEVESRVITSFYLSPEDRSRLPLFKPGQYITVRVETPNGSTTMRNYSLSDTPNRDWFRISVKREAPQHPQSTGGYVSNYLHDSVTVGSRLEVGPPCGEFFIDLAKNEIKPLVLLAAGVGITPILSILLSALNALPGHPITLIHANVNEETHAFKTLIDGLACRHPHLKVHYCYSEPIADSSLRDSSVSTGFINSRLMESIIEERDAEYYFCGPKPFMLGLYADLLAWDIPSAQLHFEFFGPRQELEAAQTLAV
ncbi:NO-inducible flavohemoprotein [Estrella lausannensis]|uniref:Flavohemoprotein n=1 Tax=Estrella lausannensis TaxID=483423 RepID=A0A0H5DTY3_9BACT|nr:NO-inducible flavohemoprotein [Estrella lausannensis]CRX39354.1 Flavohemoprotein [Estrella lausannensis]